MFTEDKTASVRARLVTEFVGTFFLCLVIGLVSEGRPLGVLAVGAVLTGAIYAGGPVSWAHYNPAVTLTFVAYKVMKPTLGLWYVLVQFAAAGMAALAVKYGMGISANALLLSTHDSAVWMAELMGTCALVFVIFHVAIGRFSPNNQYFGLAIGLTVVGCAYALGPVSGAAFNPAVALSQVMIEFYEFTDMPVILAGQVMGGLLGLGLYVLTRD